MEPIISTLTRIGTVVFGISTVILAWATYHQTKRARLQAQRFQVYRDTLSGMENLNRQLSRSFSTFMIEDLHQFLQDLLSDPKGDPTPHILSMNKRLNQRISEFNDIIARTYGQMDTLRLVASQKTLAILDRYRQATAQMLELQAKLTDSISLPKSPGEIIAPERTLFDKQILSNLQQKQTQFQEVQSQLETQMRIDLGFDRRPRSSR